MMPQTRILLYGEVVSVYIVRVAGTITDCTEAREYLSARDACHLMPVAGTRRYLDFANTAAGSAHMAFRLLM